MLKDSFIFNSENLSSETLKKCMSCFSNTHMTLYCPLLQYIPDREKIIKRYEFSHMQERESFKRMRLRSKNSLILQKKNIKIALKFQKELKKSVTLFNFTRIRALVNMDAPIDSNIFDSKNSITSFDNNQSSGSLFSNDNEEIAIYTEENTKDMNISENVVTEVGVKKNISNVDVNDGKEIKENNVTNAISQEIKEFGVDRVLSSLIENKIGHDQMPLKDKERPCDNNKKEGGTSNKSLTVLTDTEQKKFNDQTSLQDKPREHLKKELENNHKTLTVRTDDEIIRSPSNKKMVNSRKENTTSPFPKNTSKTNYNNNDSLILVTNGNTSKINTINSKFILNQPDVMLSFEKGENFDHYFPAFNLDKILQIYDKRRKKLAFLRRFHQSNEPKQEKSNSFDAHILKNFSKYSFFPHISDQNKKDLKNISEAKNLENECKSPFFAKKEFKKKATSFRVLVQNLISNKIDKKKRMTKNP